MPKKMILSEVCLFCESSRKHVVSRSRSTCCVFLQKVDNVLSDITSLSNIDFIPQFYKPIAYKNNPGMKKQYLLTLLNTSSRAIPKNQLTFLGNVGNIKRVDNEDLNSYNVNWNRFETYMIDNFKAWL